MNETKTFQVERNEKASFSRFTLGLQVLGGAEAQIFSKAVGEELEFGSGKIIIDMTNVELINSSGLGMLVAAHTAAFKRNAKVIIAAPNAKVMNLFSVTHLNQVFNIVDSLEKAEA